ncbi:MAG: hypothetical protein M3Q79_01960 [bacterium]|nr:hypothetical protein [bacterium]
MISRSDATAVMEVGPTWADSIPEDANISFNIVSEIVDDETVVYPQVAFNDGFIYYQPTEEDIGALLSSIALPMTGLLDNEFRNTYDIPEDWLLEHSITARRGGGNINISLQREWLRILESKGHPVKPKKVNAGFIHRDHNHTEDTWAFYQLTRGTSSRILKGNLFSVVEPVYGPWDIERKIKDITEYVNKDADWDKILDFASRWSFTALRMGRSALYRAQQLGRSVEAVQLEENIVYEMNKDTVHWMPAHLLSQDRAFYRDIITKMLNKAENPDKYARFQKGLQSAGSIEVRKSAIGM